MYPPGAPEARHEGDGIHGSEPWASDGTAVGTALYQDVEPGAAGSGGSGFKVSGSSLYFEATTSAYGAELWVAPCPTRAVRPRPLSTSLAGRHAGTGEIFVAISTGSRLAYSEAWATGVDTRYDLH